MQRNVRLMLYLCDFAAFHKMDQGKAGQGRKACSFQTSHFQVWKEQMSPLC